MHRLLLPAGMAALLAGALALFAQVREQPQKPLAPAAANGQKAATPEKGAIADGKAQRRRESKRVYLGVVSVPVEDMSNRTRKKLKLAKDEGVFIIEVVPDSPAEEAGLRQGDVITHVNGKLIEDEDELVKDLHQAGAGKKVDLTVIRDGKKQEMKAELGEISGRELRSDEDSEEMEEEILGMCHENALRIEHLERKISRLEKRLAEMEKSARSTKSAQ
ncbi:MAG TPA: PDZ domain-containing protein [Gemmataceae bacterium]|nr:PDZ domain-containing protein [Gemmataceae bacterium]